MNDTDRSRTTSEGTGAADEGTRPEGNETRTANRRTYLQAVGGVSALGTAALAGCADESTTDDGTQSDDEDETDGDETDDGAATGLLSTAVTDQPGDIADFESCVVTIEGIWVKPAESEGDEEDDTDSEDDDTDDTDEETDGETDEEGVQEQDEDDVDQSGGREYHAFEEPQEADLVDLQDGATQLIDDDRELLVGDYQFLQLDISSVEGVLDDGGEATVETPGNAPLQFKLAFEIREGERTVFTGDFTPVRRGQSGSYLLQPVANNLSVRYEQIGDDGDDGDDETGDDDGNDETEDGDDGDDETEDGDDGNDETGDDDGDDETGDDDGNDETEDGDDGDDGDDEAGGNDE